MNKVVVLVVSEEVIGGSKLSRGRFQSHSDRFSPSILKCDANLAATVSLIMPVSHVGTT